MTSSPISSTPNNSASSPDQISSSDFALNSKDFIQMMITQLQNQDPLDPEKNQDLLAQMSQIGQLQSTTELQTSLQTMALQSNIGAAGNLIGKSVQGLDTDGSPLSGIVTSVSVAGNNVSLELDSGKTLAMSSVTGITNATPAATGTTPTTPVTAN